MVHQQIAISSGVTAVAKLSNAESCYAFLISVKRKTLAELVNVADPAWPIIQGWISESKNDVRLFPANRISGEHTIYQIGVTAYSMLGAVALNAAGISLDHGWFRILGAGSGTIRNNLLNWNGYSEDGPEVQLAKALIVAFDVVGGFFAINYGAFEGTKNSVFYMAPDTMEWEDCEKPYSGFLDWAFHGDLSLFYKNARWNGWESESAALTFDQGFRLDPKLNREYDNSARKRQVESITTIWMSYFK